MIFMTTLESQEITYEAVFARPLDCIFENVQPPTEKIIS